MDGEGVEVREVGVTKCSVCSAEIQYFVCRMFPGIKPNICDECNTKVMIEEQAKSEAWKDSEVALLPYTDWSPRLGNREVLMKLGSLAFSNKQLDERSIYVFGFTGKCKTRSICELAKIAVLRGYHVRFRACVELMKEYSTAAGVSMASADLLIKGLVQFPGILILDDLGIGRRTDRTDELFYELMDKRLRQANPTWITSEKNLDQLKGWFDSEYLSEMGSGYGDRIVRRISDSCRIVAV